MAIKYGFFNSVNGDRKYTAADIGDYLRGIIYSGVYPDGTSSLQVLAAGGMVVEVQPGRAMLEFKYLENDAPHQIALSAGGTMDRIDAIVAYMDLNERACGIIVKEGTPAAAPVAPAMTRTDVRYEAMLASVYVTRLVNEVTQANITDTRHLTEVCGWVRGAIRQNTTDIPGPAPATAGYIPHVTQDGNGYELLAADTTLSRAGRAADAAATGAALAGKAPAGYGLGSAKKITFAELDNTYAPGWYYWSEESIIDGINANFWFMHVSAYSTGNSNAIQKLYPIRADFDFYEMVRRRYNGAWQPVEHVNPRMVPGVEYRTTERWQGKPVYTKLVDCGALPNSSAKTIAHGASVGQIVRCNGQTTSNGTPIPRVHNGGEIHAFADRGNIYITTNVNYSDQTACVQLWYIKE